MIPAHFDSLRNNHSLRTSQDKLDQTKRARRCEPLIITNLKRTNLQMQLTINQKQYEKLTDAKVRGLWANPKGLTDFLIRLLRQGGRFATKGQKGL